MKKMKKALIATSMAGALVVSAGYGTYSWFTAEATAKGTIQNGTLTLSEMGQLFNHTNFAPSQIKFSNWQTADNTGSLDQVIKISYDENLSKQSLNKYAWNGFAIKLKDKQKLSASDKAQYEAWLKWFLGGGNVVGVAAAEPKLPEGIEYKLISGDSAADANKAAAQAAPSGNGDTRDFSVDGDKDPYYKLASNERFEIIIGVKLSEQADNNYQDALYSSTLKVNAKQTDAEAQWK